MEISEENPCKLFLQQKSDVSGLILKTVDLNNLLISEHMQKGECYKILEYLHVH